MTDPTSIEKPSDIVEPSVQLDQIKKNMQEIKSSVEEVKQLNADFDKQKDSLAKDILEQKQKDIESKKNEIEAKKKETQELISKLRKEILERQKDNQESAEKTEIDKKLEELDKKVSADLDMYEKELSTMDVKSTSFWEKLKAVPGKVWEWAKENPKTAIAATLWTGLLIWWISRLFRKHKDDEENDEGTNNKHKKKKWFWNHGVGKFLKWVGIWAAATFGLSWLRDKFKPENQKDPENQKSDFDKLSETEKQNYNKVWDSINSFMQNWTASTDAEYLLWKDENWIDQPQYRWLVPYSLDKSYDNVWNIITEWAIYKEEAYRTFENIKDLLVGPMKDLIAKTLMPMLMTVKDFSVFGFKPGESMADGILRWLEDDKDAHTKYLNHFFRQYTNVLCYLESKRSQLQYKLVENALKQQAFDGKKWEELSPEDQQDEIQEKCWDIQWLQQYGITDKLEELFLKKKIVDIDTTFQQYGLDTVVLSPHLESVVHDVDEDMNDILEVDETTKKSVLDRAEDELKAGSLSEETKKELIESSEDLVDDISNEEWTGFFNKAFQPLTILFNSDDAVKDQLFDQFSATISAMQSVFLRYRDKFGTGTITLQDIQDYRKEVDKYIATKKEIAMKIASIQDINDNAPDKVLRFCKSYWAALAWWFKLFTDGKENPAYEWFFKSFWTIAAGAPILYVAWGLGIAGKGVRALKVTLAPVYYTGIGILNLSKYALGKSFAKWWYWKKEIIASSNPEGLFHYAFMSWELSDKNIIQIAHKKNWRIWWNIVTSNNVNQFIKDRFLFSSEEDVLIFRKYAQQKNLNRIMLTREVTGVNAADKLWHHVYQRKLNTNFGIQKEAIQKIRDLDTLMWKSGLTVEGKFLRKALYTIDPKDFDKFYDFVHTGNILDTIKWLTVSGETFGKNFAKNISVFTDAADVKRFVQEVKKLPNYDEALLRTVMKNWDSVKVRLNNGESLVSFVSSLSRSSSAGAVIESTVDIISPEIKSIETVVTQNMDELNRLKGLDGISPIKKNYLKKQLNSLEEFRSRIKWFSPEDIKNFKTLEGLHVKPVHIVEILDLTKDSASTVAKAFAKWDVSHLITVLKAEKESLKNSGKIVEWIEEILDVLKRSRGQWVVEGLDEAARIVKTLAKFISKVHV